MPVEERESKVCISSKLGSSAFVPDLDEVCFLHKLDPIICRNNAESAVNVVLFPRNNRHRWFEMAGIRENHPKGMSFG